jgi:glycosyltransferase involved in cell wall biosynthesis
MRVGIDATVLSYNREGIGNYLEQLLLNLPEEKNIKFIAFVSNKDDRLEEYKEKFNSEQIEICELALESGILSGVRNAYKIAKAAEELDVNLLVSTHSHILPSIFHPTIYLVHDLGPVLYPNYFNIKKFSLKRMLFNILFSRGMHEALHIITTSESIKEEIELKYKIAAEKITAIGAGPSSWLLKERVSSDIDETGKAEKILEEYGLEAKNYFLTISTLSPRKNFENLISGYRKFLEDNRQKLEHYPPKLVIAGKEGWQYQSIYKTLATEKAKIDWLDLSEQVIFTGFTEDEYLFALLNNCKSFVYPSLYEGFGIPPLEAILLDKDVILSNIPVFTEIYTGAATFFDPRSIDEIAARMAEVYFDRDMGMHVIKSARDRIIDKYNWQRTALNFMESIKNASANKQTDSLYT